MLLKQFSQKKLRMLLQKEQTYSWKNNSGPDDSTVSRVGIVTKYVSVTLPPESNTRTTTKEYPVYIKVKPQAPVIEQDSVTEKAGLPNQSIVVKNVTPGATVSMTIAGKTITLPPERVTGNTVEFNSTDLAEVYAANNGLLPEGNVTVTQAVSVSNPKYNPQDPSTGNQNELLSSEAGTGAITSERVKPVAQPTIVEVKIEKQVIGFPCQMQLRVI